MKTKHFNWLGSLFASGLAFLATTNPLFSQSSTALSIQLYAGVTITNDAGTDCSVEYTSDLSKTNGWILLTNLTLPSSPYLYIDSTVPATASRRFYRVSVANTNTNTVLTTTNPCPDKLITISPGTFLMGEAPGVEVTLTRPFYMAKNLVTQSEYQELMFADPSSNSGNPTCPVETVSWLEAISYCAKLTTREQAAGRLPSNWAYRLPTEAEWEYACRAGTTTRYSFGDDWDESLIAGYAWYSVNSWGVTHPVGTKLPNPWGLYDMHGNVHQWCADLFAVLQGGNDPTGPSSGLNRVWRGGSCYSSAGDCASLYRGQNSPNTQDSAIGFRVVAVPVQP